MVFHVLREVPQVDRHATDATSSKDSRTTGHSTVAMRIVQLGPGPGSPGAVPCLEPAWQGDQRILAIGFESSSDPDLRFRPSDRPRQVSAMFAVDARHCELTPVRPTRDRAKDRPMRNNQRCSTTTRMASDDVSGGSKPD